MTSIIAVIKRFWVVVIILLAIVCATLVVMRLRGFFGTDLPVSARGAGADSIVAFNPKTVTYEIVGVVEDAQANDLFGEVVGVLLALEVSPIVA